MVTQHVSGRHSLRRQREEPGGARGAMLGRERPSLKSETSWETGAFTFHGEARDLRPLGSGGSRLADALGH